MSEVTVVVTGGTGFIGRHLVAALHARGDRVVVLTRNVESARRVLGDAALPVEWDAPASGDWMSSIDGSTAVVSLAGDPAVGQRWTRAKKRRIKSSRVEGTKALVTAIHRASEKPAVLVSTSAVGYYGDRDGTEPVDESAPNGDDFLAEVTREWEDAARPAEALGVRVVLPRIGIVMGRGGGALTEMAKPFKLFVGGPIASGKQVVSWIHLADVVRALVTCIDDETLRGPVNVVAPDAVTNRELSALLGAVLRRPSAFRVPEAALRLRFGDGADPLVTGQRVTPSVLLQRGFEWRYPNLREALEEALA